MAGSIGDQPDSPERHGGIATVLRPHRLPTAALIVALMALAACDRSDPNANSEPLSRSANTTSAGAKPVFQSLEELVEHVRSLPSTGEGKLALYALIEPRDTTELMTVKFLRNVDSARLKYASAMNDVFGNGEIIEPMELGMPQWLDELKTVGPPRLEKRYAYLEYQATSGERKSLVLVRAGGSWHVAAATLRGGTPPDDRWAAAEQGRWGALIQHHRDMAVDVRSGKFSSADEARAELERRLSLPAPSMPKVPLTD